MTTSATAIVEYGPNIPPSTLQNRLRDAREWRGITQAQMAVEIGVGRSTISNYESGVTEPGKLVVNAWAVICDTDVEWLKHGPSADSPIGGGGSGATPERRTLEYRAVVSLADVRAKRGAA